MLKSISELSELTGKARETISKRLKELHPVKERNSLLFESTDALPLIYGHAKHEAYNLEQERARLAHHQANNEALKEAQLRGDLILVDDVAKEWCTRIGSFRAKLLQLPGNVSLEITAVKDRFAAQELLRQHICAALAELGNELSHELAQIQATGETSTASSAAP